MSFPVTEIQTTDLTSATLAGSGVFDVLMKANKAHLEDEHKKGRITGPQYSEVYLGMMTQVMQTAMTFLLERQANNLKNVLLEKQIQLADTQIEKAAVELEILQQSLRKTSAEVELLTKQAGLVEQQRLNAIEENKLIIAKECESRANFDLTMQNVTKAVQETALLTQKAATEKAQTQNIGVDENSVIGRQKGVYLAQATGFSRDAETKVARALIDAWQVKRSTDPDNTPTNPTNKLDDDSIGRAVHKMLTGVSA